MDTAPVPILVSLRTRFPAVIACLKRRSSNRPIPLYFWDNLWVVFTWAKICPSPKTKLSNPAATLNR
ncbi:hypothetical protein CY0110_19117 [Crocosphaera chwakensis CCY0110]|uniref:Uncharacterized protein n=1 Tax=Crocosphaera chwakensis CCY0110 TaxID=391612 RepID=A3IJF5_9CHRO|nr:hypothetical protein CY0110_19117 [Crocosphaera chwakensis CCY0110]